VNNTMIMISIALSYSGSTNKASDVYALLVGYKQNSTQRSKNCYKKLIFDDQILSAY